LGITEFTRSVHSLHYYNSILVIEKRPIEKPFHLKTGKRAIPGLGNSVLGQLIRFLKQALGQLTALHLTEIPCRVGVLDILKHDKRSRKKSDLKRWMYRSVQIWLPNYRTGLGNPPLLGIFLNYLVTLEIVGDNRGK
jgi:hypothetical protein